jgi:hypothetical protein
MENYRVQVQLGPIRSFRKSSTRFLLSNGTPYGIMGVTLYFSPLELYSHNNREAHTDIGRKISNLVVTSLIAADLEPEHVHKILLVGGSSKIPVFRNMVTEFFPDAEILRVNEMTSIAHGLGCTP